MHHLDPYYTPYCGESLNCDAQLMTRVDAREVQATLSSLRDAATQDLGTEAMLDVLATYADAIAAAFSTWVEAGRCLEPLVLPYLPGRSVRDEDVQVLRRSQPM